LLPPNREPVSQLIDGPKIRGQVTRTSAGKIEEGLGRVAGDAQTQLKGQARQVAGAAEDFYGQAKDAASSATDIVRRTIEEQPYKAVAIALSAGY
jgi:uncharacterized protein YjbJ (UPF0337 family)